MTNYNTSPDTPLTQTISMTDILRAIGALLGVIVIATGLFLAIKMFFLILHALQNPEAAQPFLEAWTKAIGGRELILTTRNGSYNFAPILALTVVGTGAMILARIAIALITSGAKTLTWILGDRTAVKKILTHAFGPSRKAPQKSTNENRASS